MIRRRSALALLLLLAAPAVAGPTQRFVLAAGANDGGTERTLLRYAVSDAANFADVMVQMGGVEESNRWLLSDPDRDGFEAAVRELSARVDAARGARQRTEVMLYYSGHADEDGLLLGVERLGYRELRQLLDTVSADVRIAVLDACASGAITRIKGGQRRSAFLLEEQADTRGYAFLTSSSSQESAQESDRIGASYFTYYLVTGMRGAADVSADGRVTLSEAYQFAFDETLARTVELQGGAQHPAYDMNLSGTGDVVMTDVRQVAATVLVGDDVEGRLFVRSAERRLVAELYKPADRVIELGLEPDAYDIYLEQRQQLQVARRELAEGDRWQLAAADFEVAPRQETVSRGRPGDLALAGPPAPGNPQGRFRVELHFGGIGPEPRAQPLSLEASSAPEADAGDRFDAIPAAVTQIQPWGALSGLSLGYSPSERWEVTLSWSTLGSDVDEDLNAGDELRVLQRVRLTSVILGARYYPLTATRVRPFAALGVGSFEGTETGLTREDGRDWSRGHSALGTQLGAGVDVDLSRRVTFGVRALYNWMGRFDEPIGGRQHYRGTEFRVAASWRFGGGPRL